MASKITGVSIVCTAVWSGADQRKHQSSASLAFVRRIHRWPVNSLHKGSVTRKMFPFDDVIVESISMPPETGVPNMSVTSIRLASALMELPPRWKIKIYLVHESQWRATPRIKRNVYWNHSLCHHPTYDHWNVNVILLCMHYSHRQPLL